MRIVIDEETAKILEKERAARGLRSPTEANKEIIREAAEHRAYVKKFNKSLDVERGEIEAAFADRATGFPLRLAGKTKKGRTK